MSAAPATQLVGTVPTITGSIARWAWKPKPKRNVLVRTFLHISIYVQDVLNNNILEKADRAKQWVIKPDSNVLQLDLDYPEQFDHFQRTLRFVDRTLHVKDWVRTISKSGCVHISVLVDRELNDFTRIMWQVALGSDPVREFLNMVRVVYGVKDPIVLFESPAEGERLVTCQCGKRLLPDGTMVKP